MIIDRKLYLDKIKKFIGNEQIKVITGIRRCGKSFMLDMLASDLIKDGVASDHIIKLNMEDMDNSAYRDAKACHEYITSKLVDGDKYYIFIDEVQNIERWEELVNSLRLRNVDIVITGSNSRLLSGELATLLGGRYVAFQLYNVAFSEYYNSLKGETSRYECLNKYISSGGYPIVLASDMDEAVRESVVEDIYNSTVLKDVMARNNVKDDVLMERIINYLFDNVGNLISVRKIADYLTGNGEKTTATTVGNYIKALERAFVIEKTPRYDIKVKELLSTIDKYYVADHSLMYVRKGFSFEYIGQVMENIVFNDLRRRGYRVYVGKLDDREVDFIAEKSGEKLYVQVSYSLMDNKTLEREVAPLECIKDSYPKYVISMDSLARGNKNGIKFMHLADFLLKEEL